MAKGDIQYVADTLLLEKLAVMEYGLTKNAGIVDMLGGMASSIKDEISNKVKEKGLATVLEEYLVSGAIMKMLGVWGYPIKWGAELLGFDVDGFIDSLIQFVKNAISSGKTLTLDEVNQAGKSLGGVVASSNDLFVFLRKAEFEGTIMKNAGIGDYIGKANNNIPFFGGSGGILGRIFGNLARTGNGKSKILAIIVGIIVWAVKTVLLGAGVAGVSTMIKNYKGTPSEEKSDKPTEDAGYQTQVGNSEESAHPVKVNLPAAIPNSFSSSGDGNQYHINDGTTVWVVPLVNKSVAKTLIWWTTTIYPELKGYENEISQTSSFNNMVSILSAGVETDHPDYLTIPQGLHTRKDVVDRFAGAVKLKDSK